MNSASGRKGGLCGGEGIRNMNIDLGVKTKAWDLTTRSPELRLDPPLLESGGEP